MSHTWVMIYTWEEHLKTYSALLSSKLLHGEPACVCMCAYAFFRGRNMCICLHVFCRSVCVCIHDAYMHFLSLLPDFLDLSHKVCLYERLSTCPSVSLLVCRSVYRSIFLLGCVCVWQSVCLSICLSLHMHVCIYMCTYVYICIYMYIYVHIYIHKYTHTINIYIHVNTYKSNLYKYV